MEYTLKSHGDNKERESHDLFLKDMFPTYEMFWQKFVVHLTNRPNDIHFKLDEILKVEFPDDTVVKIHERICIAQLHYSICRFLLEAYNSIEESNKNIDHVERCFTCLYSALDISSELFARFQRFKADAFEIDAFSFQSIKDSKNLRTEWCNKNKFTKDIQEIRNYRNLLVHGRLLPVSQDKYVGFIFLPKLGSEHLYLDWRNITNQDLNYSNLAFGKNLTDESFKTVIKFLEVCWKKYLL